MDHPLPLVRGLDHFREERAPERVERRSPVVKCLGSVPDEARARDGLPLADPHEPCNATAHLNAVA